MKKLLVLSLGLVFWACTSDEDERQPFVTEIVTPSSPERFVPGDEVTISALGFEADDDIMLDIRWPLPGTAIQEGYARGVWGIVTRRTSSCITFLAPGGYPASTVEILLFRQGRTQSLGKIVVADGQAPDDSSLYGIRRSGSEATLIERIDSFTGEIFEAARLEEGETMSCAVNAPGSNRIYGITEREGGRLGVYYDLTMRYWRNSAPQRYVTTGVTPAGVSYLGCEDQRLYLSAVDGVLRSPGTNNPLWVLPENLTPGMLADYPFVFSEGNLLLSANHADGTFAPVVLTSPAGGCGVKIGAPLRADGLIPFWTLQSAGETETFRMVGGYAVANTDGTSDLCLFDPVAMTWDEPFATFSGHVRSVAVHISKDVQTRELYLLLDDGRIRVFDLLKKTWRTLPGGQFRYSEIVLAR